MADEEISLSIEETNKLRISLGLKPLSVDNEPVKESAEDNYEKYKKDLKKTEETKKIQEKIQRSRNKRELKKKLSGKGLGELGEDEDDDALAWIKRQKKRQKELAELKQKELEAMDNEVIEEYKSENLKGLKVGHNISEIEAGEEEILVLKDAMITEDDDVNDELISNRLTEKERLQKNLELKKKRNVYGGVYDDEEALFGKKKILSQYDDDDDENKGFILNGKGEVFDTSIHKNDDQNGFKKGGLDLNYSKMQEIRDYYTKDEMVSFKKPKKKKKKKHSRKKLEDISDDLMDIETSMESSTQNEVKPVEKYSYSNITTNIDDVNFIDDDELQIALSKARRKKTKKLVKSLKETVEDVKQEDLKEKEKEEIENEAENVDDLSYDLRRKEESEGIKFINEVSETSEFIRNIPTLPLLQRQNQNEKSTHTENNDPIEKEDEMELESLHDSSNEEDIQEHKEESLEEGEKMELENEKDTNEQSTASNTGIAALEEEPLISSGMAATVSLLLQKGIVNPVTKEELEKEKLQLEKEKWLNEQKINDIIKEKRKQKDRDRRDRHGRSSRDRDRDYDRDDIYRERERAREAEKKFKNYKPVVNIEYHDEFGRTLTQKEAFRQLSHKFHGKTSGKLKTEKRLKKLEEELKLKQMSSTDTPLGTVSALQEKTKAMGSAHLVLSIGNRGVLPSENDIANLQPRTNIKKKSKETNSNESLETNNTQQSSFITSLNNPGNTNAPKREKITFGLKRKADQEINPVFKKRE